MTSLDRRILGLWLSLFLSILFLLLTFFLAIEGIQREKIWKEGFESGLFHLLLRTPLLLHYAVTPSVLLSTLLAGEILSRRNEILAAWALGISPFRLGRGLLFAGLWLVPGVLFLSEWGVPASLTREAPRDGIRLEWIHALTPSSDFLAMRSLAGDRADDLWLATIAPDGGSLERLVWAPEAVYDETAGGWRLRGGVRYDAPDSFTSVEIETSIISARSLSDRIRLMGNGIKTVEDPYAFERMNLAGLLERLRLLAGIPGTQGETARIALVAHRRLANAVLPLGVLFFSFFFSLRAGRMAGASGAIGRGVLLLVIGEFLYRAADGAGQYLASHAHAFSGLFGLLAAPVGAWALPLGWFAAGLIAGRGSLPGRT